MNWIGWKKIANESRIPIDCEGFGIFRDLIPAEEFDEGGSLQHCRQRNGLCPDFKIKIPTSDGPRLSLGELKFISAGASRYPIGKTEKQVDRRARELPGSYRRPLEKLDEKHGTRPGETGRLVARLQSFGPQRFTRFHPNMRRGKGRVHLKILGQNSL